MKFKIVKELYKRGDYFTAYEGIQEGLGKPIEVRVFNQLVTDQTGELARFKVEIRTLAFLDHPNILRILDCGISNSRLYYITDFKSGRPIEELMQAGTFDLSIPLKVDLAIDLARALKYMHKKGVIHRGLGITSVNYHKELKLPYVSDFSFAKNLKLDGLTARGIAQALPGLKTPEILLGKLVDVRTDIYLLGVMLFQMVTGQEPYDPDSLLGLNEAGLRAKRPRDLAALAPEVPPSLEEVILKAVSLHPDDRYSDDDVFLGELNQVKKQIRLPRRGRPGAQPSSNVRIQRPLSAVGTGGERDPQPSDGEVPVEIEASAAAPISTPETESMVSRYPTWLDNPRIPPSLKDKILELDSFLSDRFGEKKNLVLVGAAAALLTGSGILMLLVLSIIF